MIPRFWREIPYRYNLVATKCPHCNKVSFPPKEVCKMCGRSSIDLMTPTKLSGNGIIETYTTVHEGGPGFAEKTPYHIAIVKLEEGPTVTAQIIDCKGEDLKIGKKVHVVFRRISEEGSSGTIHYGYKFALDD